MICNIAIQTHNTYMKAQFKTPVFDVHIVGLADYFEIDWNCGIDYKVSKSKMLEWEMEVFALQNRLGDIIFTPKRVRFDLSWWVEEEYLNEYDALKLEQKHDVTTYKGEITGQLIIDASKETGWDIEFAPFELCSKSSFEKEIDEIEVNIFEKTILIR